MRACGTPQTPSRRPALPPAASSMRPSSTVTLRFLTAGRPPYGGSCRNSIRDLDAAVVDHQEAFPGICCVSAAAWRQNGTCAAAVTVVVADSKVPPGFADLVVHAARCIGAGLA